MDEQITPRNSGIAFAKFTSGEDIGRGTIELKSKVVILENFYNGGKEPIIYSFFFHNDGIINEIPYDLIHVPIKNRFSKLKIKIFQTVFT